MELRMVLDDSMLKKVAGYYLFRSEETIDERPIVDGLYVQRQVFPGDPPTEFSITVEW